MSAGHDPFPVAPALLNWAMVRSRRPAHHFYRRFPLLSAWLREEQSPTLTQLESFAQAAFIPLGVLFLDEPPTETLPIADARTKRYSGTRRPSPELLDTIFACQRRQEWYGSHAQAKGTGPVSFIAASTVEAPVAPTANLIRGALQFSVEDRAPATSSYDAFRQLIRSTEDAGIMVMISGMVGNNTRHTLDPAEFRGFSLADPWTPLIFINSAAPDGGQILTLVRGLCRLLLGHTALSDAALDRPDGNAAETWCHMVAAEVLVPADTLQTLYRGPSYEAEVDRLSDAFKVSRGVVLHRILETGLLPAEEFRVVPAANDDPASGKFFDLPTRVSHRFARALITDTRTGRTLQHEALRLLGVKKYETYLRLGQELGVL